MELSGNTEERLKSSKIEGVPFSCITLEIERLGFVPIAMAADGSWSWNNISCDTESMLVNNLNSMLTRIVTADHRSIQSYLE